MRITPNNKFRGYPCSYVGTGCAYENVTGMTFISSLPEGLGKDGFLSLDNMNRFIRKYLRIRKKTYFKRAERVSLKEFLTRFTGRACVCVLGHFVYVSGGDYWSFFDNDDDAVVCVWYIG